MKYEKKLIILSGSDGKASLTMEICSGGTTARLCSKTLPVGDYILGIVNGGETVVHSFIFDGTAIMKFPVVSGEIHAGIFRGRELVLYGCSHGRAMWTANFVDAVRRHLPSDKTQNDATSANETQTISFTGRAGEIDEYFLEVSPVGYDDDAIAEVNYYEAEVTCKVDRDNGPTIEAERAECAACKRTIRDFTVAAASAPPMRKATYGEKRRIEIDKLFATHPTYEPLARLLPGSDWVKVDYDNSRYYAVGKLRDRYLMYAVPAQYSPMPPREFDGFCDWVASDLSQPMGEGYYVIFQDAVTGKTVRGGNL